MQIVNDFGNKYQASQVRVETIKTLVVKVYLDKLGQLADNEMSEEELEEIAHEAWLEAQAVLLAAIVAGFPYIDIEFLSTDCVGIVVME